jgi:hypothetical protein
MTRKPKTGFIFLFLAYFVIYAVSPLSEAVPREQSPYVPGKQGISPEAVYSLSEVAAPFAKAPDIKMRTGGHIDPFIFDIALWNILKRGKHSDDESVIRHVVKKTGTKNSREKLKCGAIGNVDVLPLPFFEVSFHSPKIHLAFNINIPLLSSGLSPPAA